MSECSVGNSWGKGQDWKCVWAVPGRLPQCASGCMKQSCDRQLKASVQARCLWNPPLPLFFQIAHISPDPCRSLLGIWLGISWPISHLWSLYPLIHHGDGCQMNRQPCHFHILKASSVPHFKGPPSSVAVHSLSGVWLFATPWTAARRAFLSIIISWSLLKPMSIESVIPPNHLNLCCPLHLLPSIFPSIRVFSNESDLRIRWSKYWSFSFSISPTNEYSGLISFRIDWFDILAVQRNLQSSPAPTVQKNKIFTAQPFFCPALTSIHNNWKNYSFDNLDFCKQSNVSAF